MNRNSIETLKRFFNNQNPLGDVAALEDADDSSKLVFQTYFDLENQPFQELRREPSMIVGRKGSGKTDALLSYRYGAQRHTARYDPVIFFEHNDAANAISTVINQITDVVTDNYPPPTVESIAGFWNNLFWVTIFKGILDSKNDPSSEQYTVINRFTRGLFGGREIPNNPYHIIISTIVGFRDAYSRSDFRNAAIGFFSCHEQLQFSGLMLTDAKVAAQSWLKNNNKKSIVLFDSIEAMDLAEVHNKLVISSLLKAVGAFQSTSHTAQFRCCVPAESYFKLIDMSSNVLKDFRSNHVLHWHSSELLRICAKRYATFLELYCPESSDEFIKPYGGFARREDVLNFWQRVLPDSVPNTKKGSREATIPYITRHTQLLPRHFLLIFNRIIGSAIQDSRSVCPVQISEDTVVSAIKETESQIVDQILDSYRQIWPDADEVLSKVLPNLNKNIIGYTELHRYYNRSGMPKEAFRNISSYDDFIRMLSELGVIGRLTSKTDSYATSIFEYGEPHKLLFTELDTLCIHPIFTERYRVIVAESVPDEYLPVYPLGTDPRSSDYRDW